MLAIKDSKFTKKNFNLISLVQRKRRKNKNKLSSILEEERSNDIPEKIKIQCYLTIKQLETESDFILCIRNSERKKKFRENTLKQNTQINIQ